MRSQDKKNKIAVFQRLFKLMLQYKYFTNNWIIINNSIIHAVLLHTMERQLFHQVLAKQLSVYISKILIMYIAKHKELNANAKPKFLALQMR